jgi:hypothetical protein
MNSFSRRKKITPPCPSPCRGGGAFDQEELFIRFSPAAFACNLLLIAQLTYAIIWHEPQRISTTARIVPRISRSSIVTDGPLLFDIPVALTATQTFRGTSPWIEVSVGLGIQSSANVKMPPHFLIRIASRSAHLLQFSPPQRHWDSARHIFSTTGLLVDMPCTLGQWKFCPVATIIRHCNNTTKKDTSTQLHKHVSARISLDASLQSLFVLHHRSLFQSGRERPRGLPFQLIAPDLDDTCHT